MERRLNLLKRNRDELEKRILPRFPFCYLTFRPQENSHAYEIKDISSTGLQLSQKGTGFKEGDLLEGEIHWERDRLFIQGRVKWQTAHRVGVEFSASSAQLKAVADFLRVEKVVQKLRPLHKMALELDLPPHLKVWLRADGPVEVFVWPHSDGEVSKIQVLYFSTFFEWEDGVGAKTGRLLSKRNVDSPFLHEDEWIFQTDSLLNPEALEEIRNFISLISDDHLSSDLRKFLMRQLGQTSSSPS